MSCTDISQSIGKHLTHSTAFFLRRIFINSSFIVFWNSSEAYCLSTFPSPEGSSPTWPNFGTTATCSIQGWLLFTGGIGTTLYSGSLSIYYILTVKRRISDYILKRKVEPFLHAVPLLYSIGIGTFLGATQNFNNAGPVCWIAPYSEECRYGDV